MRKNSLVVAVPLPQKEEAGVKTKEDTTTTINNENSPSSWRGFLMLNADMSQKCDNTRVRELK